ncbi:Permease of the drug/metabolite transporter (DMT) superfamily [Malonomonas rubra DSM 5091]|uniref:Permease of the drug/metabolite transporter (DMT) superfamily n=1 Tax=Malonomonas rubra DSM 5091 TaxID=1122189 RepID=A0A1M6JSV9_MALRU|nr:DMT family transporter [Malonomonas rubra]SHJ49751.1 Permease of the drug/metabolite transporter (DMT) superfamily [Malonomonas rubra DSM 5091]
MTENTRRLLPTISLISAMLLWASSFVALKIAFRGYHPMQVIFGRMFIASLCFLPFIPAFSKLNWRKQDLKYLLIMAICEPCLYFIFEAKALELTSASQAGMITAILPLLVAILAWAWLKEQISRQTLIGFSLAIAGACWLSLASETSINAPNPLLGNFYEFLAMVCAAGYTVSLKHLSENYPPLFLTAVQAFLGSLFFFPFLLLPSIGFPGHLQATPAVAIIYLGTFITFGAYGCYNYGVSRIPASQAAGYVNLIPVFGVILGMLILGDRLNFAQWLACGLVFCGVWLSSRSKKPLVQPAT